jgi:hypothetical protein
MTELTLLVLLIGQAQEDGDKRTQVFTEKPCLGMDNHFIGKHVDTFIGSNGYKGVYTTQRGRFQGGLKSCLNHVKQIEVCPRLKAAKFANPGVVVKEVKGNGRPGNELYCVVHIFLVNRKHNYYYCECTR